MATGQGGYSTDGVTIATVDQVGSSALVSVDTQAPSGSSPQTLAMTLAQIATGSFGSVAAAGATQGDATAITTRQVVVTATASTEGVILPSVATGSEVHIFSNGAVGVKVYPATNDQIQGGTTNAAVVLAGNKANIYVGADANNWVCLVGA